MTYQQYLQQATIQLSKTSSTPYIDAQVLLSFVTGQAACCCLAFDDNELPQPLLHKLMAVLARRQIGEPIAYIVGKKEFWSLPLNVTLATLIPRPETEILVEQALMRSDEKVTKFLDLGTGSGSIALALSSERPKSQITAVDCCPQALSVAQKNASQLAMSNINFLLGNWFSPLKKQKFNIIVSNPPYLSSTDPHLFEGDVRFEPKIALVAAENGLANLRYIAQLAVDYLLPDGWLILEHGWQQGKYVANLLTSLGYQNVTTVLDYAAHQRVCIGQFKDPL